MHGCDVFRWNKMPTDFSFEVTSLDASTAARLGTLRTGHGEIPTPVFMPVGTAGTVKALPPVSAHVDGNAVKMQRIQVINYLDTQNLSH
jgi:hypothetical protein